MFQRQELKGALARTLGFRSTSAATSDAGAGNTTFTQAELRDLFSYVKDTRCDTADRIDARGRNAGTLATRRLRAHDGSIADERRARGRANLLCERASERV